MNCMDLSFWGYMDTPYYCLRINKPYPSPVTECVCVWVCVLLLLLPNHVIPQAVVDNLQKLAMRVETVMVAIMNNNSPHTHTHT